MTAVLLWKEYRQQRAVWLAIAALAVLLTGCVLAWMGHRSEWGTDEQDTLRAGLNGMLLCLVVVYGIVSGALLLASEKEEGTLAFLDNLVGWRGPLYARKLAAGVALTLSQCAALTGLALGLRFGSWEVLILLPLVGLNALAWGLLGGALCRGVLSAILTAVGLMAASWILGIFARYYVVMLLLETAVGFTAGYASWRIFCRDDRIRQPARSWVQRKLGRVFPASWRVVLWLALRQGRWVLAGGAVGVLALGVALSETWGVVVWPLGTLLLGLVFGLAAFCPDQRGGHKFLGAQRIPLGHYWTVKTLLWAIALCGAEFLAWQVYELSRASAQTVGKGPSLDSPSYWIGQWRTNSYTAISTSSVWLFLGLWPLYGFCFGLCLGQLVRRPVLALILSGALTPAVVAVWVPSLLLGGFPVWQAAVIPCLLLLTARLTAWPWASGRLVTAKPIIGIAYAALVMMLTLIGFIWHRATEVPNVGEPFDVKAFIASLPAPEKNEAGVLIRQACSAMAEDRRHLELQLGPAPKPGSLPNGAQPVASTYDMLLGDAVAKGWPKEDGAIARFLDGLFQGEWVSLANKAAQLPLGMVQDPRLVRSRDDSEYLRVSQQSLEMARLFEARALQLQAKRNFRGALDLLETTLALSRQARHDAPIVLFSHASAMELTALNGFRHWIQQVGPDKALLRTSLGMLRQHEAAIPDPAQSLKAEYLVERDSGPSAYVGKPPAMTLRDATRLVPWEQERQTRLFHALFLGYLQAIQERSWDYLARLNSYDPRTELFATIAATAGLPPQAGPGSSLSAQQWGDLILQCQARGYGQAATLPMELANTRRWLRATQLVTALALYQAENGSPAAKLDALVPAYLTALPIDPYTGEPFHYRISQGEEIGHQVTLAPGQALIWSGNHPSAQETPVSFRLPVPVWTK
jgi:hypothetical protein